MKKWLYFNLILALVISSCGDGEDPTPDPCAKTITISISSQQNASNGQSDGSVTVTASGGNGGMQFKIGSGSFQASGSFSSLAAGNYTITAKDSEGCTATLSLTISEDGGAQTTPSFANDVMPIMETRCATSGCHVNGGSAPFAITGYSDVQARAQSIKTRVAAQTMPPSGSTALSSNQIATIVAWVDAGAPNN